MDEINMERAERFSKAIKAYNIEDNDDQANIRDILTDAQHWCRATGIDFDSSLAMSRKHFEAESSEEG